jgi:hypothetical protein
MYVSGTMHAGMKHSAAIGSILLRMPEFSKNARNAACQELKLATEYEQRAEYLKNAPPSHAHGAHR